MNTVYVVLCGRAFGGDDMPTDAYAFCAGVFTSVDKAKSCLKSQVDTFIADLRKDLQEEDAEEAQALESSIKVTGSVNDWSFEVDYEAFDTTRVEWYFAIQEMKVEA